MADSDGLGETFGKVGMGNQTMLAIMGRNRDVGVGEIFLISSNRDGHRRVFFFRVLGLQNYLRQVEDIDHIAGTLMVEGDAYLSGIERNMLLAVDGKMLGYAELKGNKWDFKSPRRMPDHLADVYRPRKGSSDQAVREMLASQTSGEIYVGDLQVGEDTLDVPVSIPAKRLPMHVGIYGATGAGKSNLLMVLIKSIIDSNLETLRGGTENRMRVSAFCIDPHDEFARGIDTHGIQDIVEALDQKTRSELLSDFYYLTPFLRAVPREVRRYAREIRILWDEIQPRDLYSIMDFTPQMSSFIDSTYAQSGENWISEIVGMEEDPDGTPRGTLNAVQRRFRFLERSPIFTRSGTSVLEDVFVAMESGRVLIVNTSLMDNMEQFLLTTVVTRTVSDFRRALKSSGNLGDLERQGQMRLPQRFFAGAKAKAKTFYSAGGASDDSPVKDPRDLPAILVTVEEAPSILNPELMRGQSVFKDIARQGRKFNIGLLVVSQQVSVLDNVILSQMNTQVNLRLGNEHEIKSCIENASINISGFENEFRVMSRGEALLTASYRELPLPVRIPLFDTVFERDRSKYKSRRQSRDDEEHIL